MYWQTVVNRISKNYAVLFLALLMLFYLINGIVYLKSQSITYDEGPYFFMPQNL
jgi:hypothetical protein